MREVVYNEYETTDLLTVNAYHDFIQLCDYDVLEAVESERIDAKEALAVLKGFLKKSKNKLIPAIVDITDVYGSLGKYKELYKWEEILYENSG